MPSEKRVPERRCLGCGKHFPKSDLIRIVRLPDGTVETDPTGKKPGRGAYICTDENCIAKGYKRLSRSLSAEIGGGIYAELTDSIKKR